MQVHLKLCVTGQLKLELWRFSPIKFKGLKTGEEQLDPFIGPIVYNIGATSSEARMLILWTAVAKCFFFGERTRPVKVKMRMQLLSNFLFLFFPVFILKVKVLPIPDVTSK